MILLRALVFLLADIWEAHYSQGRALAQRGEWKKAEIELRQVVKERADFLPGRLALGTVLGEEEDWSGAEAQFRAALSLDPKSSYAAAQLAQSLGRLKRGGEAVSLWKEAVSLEPDNPDFHAGLAAAQYDSGDLSGAQKTLEGFAGAYPQSVKAQFSLASLYARRGLFAEASEAYRRTLHLEPGNEEARIALVKSLLAADDPREALHALDGRTEDFDTLVLRGAAHRGLGEDEQAAADLAAAVRLRPDDFDARYNFGFVLSRMGKPREAREQLERATAIRPESTEARYRLALVLKSLHEEARADEELRRFEQSKKQGLNATVAATSLAAGNETLSRGNAAEAMVQYQEAIRLNPGSASGWYNLALAQERTGKVSEEEQSLRKAIELDPRFALAHNQLGLVLLPQGKRTEAKAQFETGLRLDAGCAACASNLGVLYGQQGDLNTSKNLFARALAIDPQYHDARSNLGIMLATEGRFAEAEKQLEGAEPNWKNLTALGMVQTKLGKPDAIKTFRKVVAMDPGSAEARLNLGIALADNQKQTAALEQFTEAVRLAPNDPRTHYNRGRVLKDLGRLEEAAPELDAASTIPEALMLNATVQQQLEHRERAIALLRSVLAREPRNVRAWFLLGQNLQQSGKETEAVTAWRRALEIDPNHGESLYGLFRALASTNPVESKALEARFRALKQQNQVVSRAETMANFALASVAQKDWEKAISQMQEAIQLCGDCVSRPDLRKNLGLIECQAGDVGSGERDLRLALKDRPNDPDILKALNIVEQLRRAPAR